MIYEECSGQLDTSTATLYISDYTPMQISLLDSVNICDQQGEFATLKSNLAGGLDPLTINWSNGSNLDSITVSPSKTTTFSVIALIIVIKKSPIVVKFGFNVL